MPASEDVFVSSSAALDPAQQSSEQLLEQLTQAVKARRRHRNRLKFWYGVDCTCYFAVIGYSIVIMFLNHTGTMSLIGLAFLSQILTIPFFYWFNKSFYRRQSQARDLAIMELARRGEERALGPLLELMDIRLAGNTKSWAQSGPVFVTALTILLSNLTPEGFSRLTDAQVQQLTPLLLTWETGLAEGVAEMFARCGDARALRALQKYGTVYKMQRVQKYNPFLMVVKAGMKRNGMVMVNQDSAARALRCCEAIQPRVEEEGRMAQLLRASSSAEIAGEVHARQLLRGAMPTAATSPDQLLRPANSENTFASVETEAELDTEIHASKTIAMGQAGVSAQDDPEEVLLTRG